ncbi:MAG: transposase [Nostoc sp.]|uniref:transposase n=1 Tax=Nostoc sp. TaxID=1180 RepID=UPI002FF8BDE5
MWERINKYVIGVRTKAVWDFISLTGRTITLKGVKPLGLVGWQRKNFYLYGVVEPATGDSFFWEFSHLDGICFQDFLDLFSKIYPDSLNLIQMDNGSFHKSLDLRWPDNVIPIFQPANSPELNPIERLWEHIKYSLSWEHCTSLDDLRKKLKNALDSILPETIASICGWDYIISALLSATS